jgi:ribosomal protein S8
VLEEQPDNETIKMNTFQLSKLITTLNIARQGHFKSIKVDNTKLTLRLLELMQEIGIIRGYCVMPNDNKFKVFLKYKQGSVGMFFRIELVSKPSKRVYVDMVKLYKMKERCSKIVYIISTPKGIVSDAECVGHTMGGEVLLKIIL